MALRLAAFTKNGENPNYLAFLRGVEKVAAAVGATATRHFPAIPDDPAQQIALLRAVVAEKPDAIIFAPADDRQLEGPVAEAIAQGIPFIGFVNRMKGDFVSFVGADDVAMGRTIAGVLIAALHGRGDVVLIEGPDTAPTSRDRGRGFREAIAASPGIRLVGTAPGRYLRRPGRGAMEALLAQHPRIDGVICTNDLMALGALDALEAAGRHALVVGNNGTIDAAREIARGRLLASMDYDGFKMGAIAAMAALRHLVGIPVPREILLPAQVIDRANHAAWLVPIEERPLPDWDAMVTG
ncbi:sugar ABC transporter substrate-binding protein [Neoroseomonas oryzicola]|uniref:Sugar ABC transporter substrate-binding protein n=1 Tax=Neoroseomonas oryzicola TaxID=535904 RepID=A0A9X9WNI0_9PROT|nr:sugar ABC transporter substrate-binding protein [Neoroseomonas oryzicola]MBR0661890.1 sugar ABC transporter substrate-binding protein [Neoroseomonas oryzicola]NKE17055.1 sugar ABC transporter substrate-binding protein [Neoroseomonas oryzicola]